MVWPVSLGGDPAALVCQVRAAISLLDRHSGSVCLLGQRRKRLNAHSSPRGFAAKAERLRQAGGEERLAKILIPERASAPQRSLEEGRRTKDAHGCLPPLQGAEAR